MPADSTATSVPAPMAIPTSAVASAGASFTPSPTMATLRPPSWKRLTAAALSAGRTCAATSSMPSRRATESATAWLSPVIIATRTPSAWRASTASPDSGRTSSSTATMPATAPSTTTWRTVRPSPIPVRRLRDAAPGPAPASRRGPPTSDVVTVRPGARTATGQRLEAGGRRVSMPAAWRPRRSRGRADAPSRPRPPPRARGHVRHPSSPPRRRRGPARPWSGCRSCRR